MYIYIYIYTYTHVFWREVRARQIWGPGELVLLVCFGIFGEYVQKYEEAMKHVEFCMELYKLQIAEGKYFLHEHPLNKKTCVSPFSNTSDVFFAFSLLIYLCLFYYFSF